MTKRVEEDKEEESTMWSDSIANKHTFYPHSHLALEIIKILLFSYSVSHIIQVS